MTRSRQTLGQRGEAIAARYLTELGFTIEARNVRLHRGELDLVAWDGDMLVFVEVRTRRSDRMGGPLESVDRQKRRRLALLAREYLQRQRLFDVNCRFDVVGLTWDDPHSDPIIHHIPHAFSV